LALGGELSEKGGGGLGLMAMQIKSEWSSKTLILLELAPGYFFLFCVMHLPNLGIY
jgi:hypothetical protein